MRAGYAPPGRRIALAAAAVGLCVVTAAGVAGCTTGSAKASDPVPKSVKEGTGAIGAACYYLSAAEKDPVGSDQAILGQAFLAHAQTLSFTAERYDKRWTAFAADMQQIGQANGQPALDRVSAVCKQWKANPNYYTTHMPPS